MRMLVLAMAVMSFIALDTVQALTIDEIIKLKQGGVSDETIQLLIRRDSDYRLSGTWKTKDGWIIHSTEMGARYKPVDATYQNLYPIDVYPQVFPRRR